MKIDQSECESLDYGAEAVANALALAVRDGTGLQFRGLLPEHESASRIAYATGFPKQLGFAKELPEFITFPLKQGRKKQEDAGKSSERDRYVDLFVKYINRCLKSYGARLTNEGRSYIAGLAGELIGNAQEHSGRPEWWIGGYLRHERNGEAGCQISIFNFGRTIYKSLQDLSKQSKLRQDIERLTTKHTQLNVFRNTYSEEQLWTLYALQAGVSRYNTQATTIGHRGQGTVEVIDYFQQLGQSGLEGRDPKMCLISGNTYILFDDRYEMKTEVNESGEERRIIAFNESNDITDPPDQRNVQPLNQFFPGTLLSMRFYLNRSHLRDSGDQADGT